MSAIRTAVLLAAGEGSRLRSLAPCKPLCPVNGKPLLDHAVDGLASVGIERVIVVTGHCAEAVESHVAARSWPARLATVRSADWRLPNGVSLVAAAPLLGEEPALLAMCDHIVDPGLYGCVREAGAGDGLGLAVDRRLGQPLVDPDDVTCVWTQGTRIDRIGKGLQPHNGYDTGVFAIGPAFLRLLSSLEAPSITDGVRLMAAQGKARAVECGPFDWVDVDDLAAWRKAESLLWASSAQAGLVD
jgi:choline kinase